jgi:hypothetical protein
MAFNAQVNDVLTSVDGSYSGARDAVNRLLTADPDAGLSAANVDRIIRATLIPDRGAGLTDADRAALVAGGFTIPSAINQLWGNNYHWCIQFFARYHGRFESANPDHQTFFNTFVRPHVQDFI